ncbi:hypothetical protein BDZ94DRAFT_1260725 [Collybia nuda]|uniref:Uncharacterized protein n=1 Tax=Collybia nuda TaxID=64659 RepID=A0A9P5Y3F5_9AGAR|nr:hypothetical protein BDZ94DRAFT_1260725 [Collybia nuda]
MMPHPYSKAHPLWAILLHLLTRNALGLVPKVLFVRFHESLLIYSHFIHVFVPRNPNLNYRLSVSNFAILNLYPLHNTYVSLFVAFNQLSVIPSHFCVVLCLKQVEIYSTSDYSKCFM